MNGIELSQPRNDKVSSQKLVEILGVRCMPAGFPNRPKTEAYSLGGTALAFLAD